MADFDNEPVESDEFEELPGKDQDTARVALKATELAGRDPGEVRTTSYGYLIHPDARKKLSDARKAVESESTDEEHVASLHDGSVEGAAASVGDPDHLDGEAGNAGTQAAAQHEQPQKAPAKSASKGDWEAYAVSQGYDPDEGLTKDQLVERYGANEED